MMQRSKSSHGWPVFPAGWRTMSLRVKFTLALLFTSFMAIACIGSVAHWMLFREFGQADLDSAYLRFRNDVAAYVEAYGSWGKASQAEVFGEFSRRQGPPPSRAETGGALENVVGWLGVRRPEAAPMPAGGGMDSRGGAPPRQGVPPPPGGPMQGPGPWGPPGPYAPHVGPGNPNVGVGPPTESRMAGQRTEGTVPPFRFLLIGPDGKVLSGDNETYLEGQVVDADVRKKASPLQVQGKLIGYTAPLSAPNLTDDDQAYLQAIREALVVGAVVAAVFTLVFGLIAGGRLCAGLRDLTQATRLMREGQLRQSVQVGSLDEVGILARAFNRMSCDLARAHEELAASAEQIRAQADQLKELSIRDGLTQLYNRRHFDEQAARMFAEARRYGQPLAFMIGDIDFFKRINDRFSHSTGDEVLRRVAGILGSQVRESDLVARYGGEEFVIAFPQTSAEQARVCCENLRRSIEGYPWHQVHPDLRVTMSMGVSDDLSQEGFERVLAVADGYLYRAKESGRNQVVTAASSALPAQSQGSSA